MFNNVKTKYRNVNYLFFFLVFVTYIFVYPCYKRRGKLGSKSLGNWHRWMVNQDSIEGIGTRLNVNALRKMFNYKYGRRRDDRCPLRKRHSTLLTLSFPRLGSRP